MAVCPEQNQFKFEYKGKCKITTCQYCTNKTVNGCLSLDRRESGDRPITVAELTYYKGEMYPEFGALNKKASEAHVRRTVNAVREITALYLYVVWLDSNIKTELKRQPILNNDLKDFVSLVTKHLPEFRLWMLPFLFRKKYKVQFFSSEGKRMNIVSLNLGLALDVHNKRLQTILELVKGLSYATNSK